MNIEDPSRSVAEAAAILAVIIAVGALWPPAGGPVRANAPHLPVSEVIVRAGDEVTPVQFELLDALGLTAGETDYGLRFTCAVARDNIFATQFHPEKSAALGLALYRNFLHWKP